MSMNAGVIFRQKNAAVPVQDGGGKKTIQMGSELVTGPAAVRAEIS